MTRPTLTAGPEQLRAHASNRRIAEISAYVAKQKANEKRKNARADNAPTAERAAKGGLVKVPVYAANGFVEAHRYEDRTPAPIDGYKARLPARVAQALTWYAHDALQQEAQEFRGITLNLDRVGNGESRAAGAGSRLGGLGAAGTREREAYNRHEWIRERLRAFEDPEDRMTIEGALNAVVGYVRDGLAGRDVRLADIGRNLFSLRDEATAKGVAIGAILCAGKFLANQYYVWTVTNGGRPRQPMREINPPEEKTGNRVKK